MIFRRKKELSAEQQLELLKSEVQQRESEKQLEEAKTTASHFKKIREANHFAEQFAKALGGEIG